MAYYHTQMKFEWDPDKANANQKKHGISFKDAIKVFDDDDAALELYDEDHSDCEDRFITIGPIRNGLVIVVWTERLDDVIRVISARWVTLNEQQLYRNYMEQNR